MEGGDRARLVQLESLARLVAPEELLADPQGHFLRELICLCASTVTRVKFMGAKFASALPLEQHLHQRPSNTSDSSLRTTPPTTANSKRERKRTRKRPVVLPPGVESAAVFKAARDVPRDEDLQQINKRADSCHLPRPTAPSVCALRGLDIETLAAATDNIFKLHVRHGYRLGNALALHQCAVPVLWPHPLHCFNAAVRTAAMQCSLQPESLDDSLALIAVCARNR